MDGLSGGQAHSLADCGELVNLGLLLFWVVYSMDRGGAEGRGSKRRRRTATGYKLLLIQTENVREDGRGAEEAAGAQQLSLVDDKFPGSEQPSSGRKS